MRFLPVQLPPLALLVLTGLLSCGQALPDHATVRRAIDGDTVELADGRLLRYIGVDTPEVRRRQDGRWIVDPEPLGQAAAEFNRRLVEGRVVRLEYDVQTHDRYGRLLAYVYVGEMMVNAELLRMGFAQPLTIPPNLKHVDRFRALAEEARRERRGLWAAPSGDAQGEGPGESAHSPGGQDGACDAGAEAMEPSSWRKCGDRRRLARSGSRCKERRSL